MNVSVDSKIKELEYVYKERGYIVKVYNINCIPSIFAILIGNNNNYQIILLNIDDIIPLDSNIQAISRQLFLALGTTKSNDDGIVLKRPHIVQHNDIEVINRAIESYIDNQNYKDK